MTDANNILVAVLGAPHGVRGELRLKSFTEDPFAVTRYGPLATADGRRTFTISTARLLKGDMLVVRLDGVDDRTTAEALTNVRLHVPRSRLPAADDDEFYHADLVGLAAETEAGEHVGRVVAVQNFGAGDLLEIAPAQGPTLLVPFAKAFVPVVDLPGRRLVVAESAIPAGGDTEDGPV